MCGLSSNVYIYKNPNIEVNYITGKYMYINITAHLPHPGTASCISRGVRSL